MRYRFTLLVMLTHILLFALFFAACTPLPEGGSPAPETESALPAKDQTQSIESPPDVPNGTWARLLSSEELTVSTEMVEAFFSYYREHNKELRTLPSFEEEGRPNWDELTHFVFYHCNLKQDSGEYLITKEAFEAATTRYFGDLAYQHRASSFFEYAEEGYIPTGWDDHGAVLYRLKDIEKEGDVFTAAFDGISLYESDYLDPYDLASPNMKAILNADNRKSTEEINRSDIDRLALGILLKDDYRSVFEIDQTVTVRFRLSEDDKAPFIYLFCKRIYYS